jgi:hypothetical protein
MKDSPNYWQQGRQSDHHEQTPESGMGDGVIIWHGCEWRKAQQVAAG